MLEDVLIKGFVKLKEIDGLDLIKIGQFKLLNMEERGRDNGVKDVDPELASRLNIFALYLKEKYIDKLWPKSTYNKFIVWDGVDRDNQGWHTDSFESYDYFFLYYFDDTASETGGEVCFKWKDENGKECFETFQPKAGDLFLVSNLRGFWHKAGASKIQRRVASFDYNTGNL